MGTTFVTSCLVSCTMKLLIKRMCTTLEEKNFLTEITSHFLLCNTSLAFWLNGYMYSDGTSLNVARSPGSSVG